MSTPRAQGPRQPSVSRVRPGPEGRARRRGPAWTPMRIALIVGLLIGLAVLIYGVVFDRGSSSQLGAVVGGLVLSGLALIGLAIVGAAAIIRNGRRGEEAGAFWAALIGGACAVAAAGCLATALIFLLVSDSAG